MLKPLKSFPQIARESFGDLGAIVLSVTLYFELFSCLAVYFVSLGDHMHNLVPILSMRAHMIVMAFAVAAPTIILRTPTLLSYLSAVGTVATVFVVLSVCLVAITYGDMSEKVAFSTAEPPPYHVIWRPTGMPIALGLVAYCFSGHALIPSIYVTMKDPRMYERMATATFVLVLVCSLLVAISVCCIIL
jgi:vesicular inhibitory amino acid transporter